MILSANYYTKVMIFVDVGASAMAVLNGWRHDDPVAIFRYLETVEKAILGGGQFLPVKVVIFLSAKAGIAAMRAGNRIADRKVLEASAVGSRESPSRHA